MEKMKRKINEFNKPGPKPKYGTPQNKHIIICVTPNFHEELSNFSKDKNMTISDFVRECIQEKINKG